MKAYEIVVVVLAVLIVAGVITGTLIKKYRNKKKGIIGCCCDCAHCSACPHCTQKAVVAKDDANSDQ